MTPEYPFSAMVGQERAKRALLLACLHSAVGGVLLVGERGCGKSLLAYGVRPLFPERPYRVIPLNATPERLRGGVDAGALVRDGRVMREPGLLEAAKGGILCADEVNLFPDGAAELLLEAVGDGAGTTLIGTMDPEEGALRPQLLERFGLCVEMRALQDKPQRMEVLRRRMDFERDAAAFFRRAGEEEAAIRARLERAYALLPAVTVPEDILRMAADLVRDAGCQGNRAEILLVETARAAAALDGKTAAARAHLREAAEFVLPHRMRRDSVALPEACSGGEETVPQEPDGGAVPDAGEARGAASDTQTPAQPQPEEPPEALLPLKLVPERAAHRKYAGTGKRIRTRRDARIGQMLHGEVKEQGELAVYDTLKEAAFHRLQRPCPPQMALALRKEDIRRQVKEGRTGASILFVVDASGSMGAKKRIRAAKAAVLSLLQDAYVKRDRVGIVAFRGQQAQILLPPTRSIELARRRLSRIPTGGTTPLAAGLELAYTLFREEQRREKQVLQYLILLTDGRANVGSGRLPPDEAALRMAETFRDSGIHCMVLDTENQYIAVGLAKELAERMGGSYASLQSLSGTQVRDRTAEFVRR